LALSADNGETDSSENTAIGDRAGYGLRTGIGNVYIGEHETARDPGENYHTYIHNINTTSVSGGFADTVTIDLNTGLLGHLTSSRRHKEDIKAMDNASETLYRLKPVTYRYKKEIDRNQVLDYGLIAEEVAEVDPNLALRNGDGQIESVRYNAISVMLLNEFLKEHKKVEQLDATVAQQRKDFEAAMARQQKELEAARTQQQNEIEVLTASLKEQAAQIQKVNAQIKISKRAARVVTNP
jgi:hypothetical protein